MALYHYSLRTETKQIAGITIGRYSYAYKASWDCYPGSRDRRVAVAEHHAENAAYVNRGVRHFIMTDKFSDAVTDKLPVFRIDRDPPATVCENIRGAEVVGYIRKIGRNFIFEAK